MCKALQKFIHDRVLSRQWLAEQLGIGEDSLSRYINGKRIPNKEIMKKIFEITHGDVRPDHFYDLPNHHYYASKQGSQASLSLACQISTVQGQSDGLQIEALS